MNDTLLFITGASSGIGQALALEALERGGHVIGISRSKTIDHSNYTHLSLDLSEVKQVAEIAFEQQEHFKKLVLVNNAGTLGEIKYLGDLTQKSIENAIQLNFTAPFVLLNNFIKAYINSFHEKVVINISSGAGKNPYDGWSEYCSTKAGLDMLTKVAKKELDLKKVDHFYVFAASPGVVETNMQEQIRSTSKTEFSLLDKFIEMKENNVNKSPAQSAKELLRLVENPTAYQENIFPDFWQS